MIKKSAFVRRLLALNLLLMLGFVPEMRAEPVASKSSKSEKVGGSEWRQRMQTMLADVVVLFPLAFDEARFKDPANAEAMNKSMASLLKNSKELKKHTSNMSPEQGLKVDPSFSFIAESFSSELSLAQTTPFPRSQTYLRAALSKCVMCHTQSANGPELKIEEFKKSFSVLAPNDRFLALIASRQYDAGLEEFQQILKAAKTKKPETTPFDRNTRVALSLLVRVKKSPDKSLELIEHVTESGAGSTVLQSDLKDWKKATVAWKSEKPSALSSDEEIFVEAQRLVRLAGERGENHDIPRLRASALLHDLLSRYPQSTHRAESYLMLATVYDALAGFGIWNLSEEYLGACIQENPHSKTAEKCFAEYETSVVGGYTGSSGTHLPKAVKQHLETMRILAEPTKAQPGRSKR